MAHELPNCLSSPYRRPPTQEFDYRGLLADERFHTVIRDKRQNVFSEGVVEVRAAFNSRFKQAALDYVRAANEHRSTLLRNRGIMYIREYEAYREAISCFNRALEISHGSPSRHMTLANRAAAYIKTRQYADALADADEAVKLSPDCAIAYSLVGYCQSQLGLVREAIEKYMALQFNPADACSQKLLEDAIGSLISSIDHNANHAETLEVTKAPQPPSLTVEYREEADSSVPCEGLRRATHQRYLNSVGRASSSQTMIKRTWLDDEDDLEGAVITVVDIPRPETDRRREAEKTAGQIKALESMTGLPKKLKRAMIKKYLRRRTVILEAIRASDNHGRDLKIAAGKKTTRPLYHVSVTTTRDCDVSVQNPPPGLPSSKVQVAG